MYLHKLEIEGFKSFGNHFEIEFAEGLNVLVGENGVGKSAVVDAIRLILHEDEYGRSGIDDTDFNCQFEKNAQRCESIDISVHFEKLSHEEQVAFLPWTDLHGNAVLNLRVDGPLSKSGRYKRFIWGGASKNSIFEWDLMDTINCIYVPPLRDAEARLREGRGSRLARFIKNINRSSLKDEANHPLVKKVTQLNKDLAKENEYSISGANDRISTQLKKAVGEVFGQGTTIQFAETSFNRIVESLRLLFFPFLNSNPDTEQYRTLEENSLGYNNLLYLATILAELTTEEDKKTEPEYLRVLLIEEPEAHLHPQLQTKLLEYLEDQANIAGIQVIVTTHSPVLASAASIDSIIHLSGGTNENPTAIRLSECGLASNSKAFISRWLDATKSILLFAKGIILVEGIAEALILPELAKRVLDKYNADHQDKILPPTLADAGISVINMGGIYFQHFMQLFCNIDGNELLSKYKKLPVRCSGITDNDPPDKDVNKIHINPTPANPVKGKNFALELINKVNDPDGVCRLYAGQLKTLEYDLAMEADNLGIMMQLLSELWPTQDSVIATNLRKVSEKDWSKETDEHKADASRELLTRVEDTKTVGKGIFAQVLAEKLASPDKPKFTVPKYIHDAILWAMGNNDV